MIEAPKPIWAPGTIDFDDCSLRARQRYSLAIDEGTESPAPHVSVEVLVGHRHHPLLMLVAGVHGDEYDGILALGELAREIDPETLNGMVVIVPVANPFAHAAGQRRTPVDDTDLNRVFPGRPDGTLSERLADRLCRGLLRQADLIFTLHGATSSGYLSPWIEFLEEPGPMGDATFAMAQATGFPALLALDNLPGRLQRSMADFGVPVVEAEVGGHGATRRENVDFYKERVLALVHHAGLLPTVTSIEPPPPQTIWRLGSIAAEVDGIFLRDVELSAAVRAGDVLGRIVDATGTVLAEVNAPEDCTIGGYRDHAGVRAGDSLFNLWLPADQSRLRVRP